MAADDWRSLASPAERLVWSRKRRFEDATEAARTLDVPPGTYLGHENGSRGLARAGQRYANYYDVSFDWLMTGRGDPAGRRQRPQTAPDDITRVPLIDWVSAGRLAQPSSQIPIEDVPLLAFADLGRGEFFATKVQGDSMDRVAPEGATIIVNRANKTLISGKHYIFEVHGQTTFKMWQAGVVVKFEG